MIQRRLPLPVAFWAMLVLACSLRGAAAWANEELTDADRAAIRSVIQRQLDAFQRDDGPAAFALASPGIRARFGDAAAFMTMVRHSYGAVYRPRHVAFLEAGVVNTQAVQKVLIVGPDGVQVLAIYPMEKMPDGSWVTDGCMLLPLPSKST